MYDATDKSYGRLLLTKEDFVTFGYTKESAKEKLGLDSTIWNGYDSLYFLLDIYKSKGICNLFEKLK